MKKNILMALTYFDSPNRCIATLSKVCSDDFIERIKKRDDVLLIGISEENRDLVKESILDLLFNKI